MGRPENLRKAAIIFGMSFSFFSENFVVGHTNAMIVGLTEEKKQLNLTDENISLIVSIFFLPMGLGTLLGTILAEKIGRRIALLVFTVPDIFHWLMIYFSQGFYVLLIARVIAGISFGGALPLIFMIIAECCSPATRGLNLALLTAVIPTVGVFAGSNLGLALSWRPSALVALGPSFIASLAPIFCVESPAWLASRGKFKECETAYISLHGHSPSAQKELNLILEVEKTKFNKTDKNVNTIKLVWQELKTAVNKSYFWNIMCISIAINIYKMISGKIIFNIFGVIILQEITGLSDVLPYSLLIQGACIVISPSISFLLKWFKVRRLLFPIGVLCNTLLLALAVSLYVHPDYEEGSVAMYSNIIMYGVFLILAQLFVFPLLETIPHELFPLEIKGACSTIISFLTTGFMFLYMKITPDLFQLLGYPGAFILNVIVVYLFLVYLWFRLPETKDRMLHEIELYFKNKTFLNVDEITGEQMKVLV